MPVQETYIRSIVMRKEKMNKKLTMYVQPSLHADFHASCSSQYKTISEVVRDLMLQYVQEYKKCQSGKETARSVEKN